MAAEWRAELLDGTGYAFGRTQQERERKRPEEAARRKYGEPRATWWRVTRLVGLMGMWTVRCSTGGAVRTLSRSTVTTFS